jgi:hypothetical protein
MGSSQLVDADFLTRLINLSTTVLNFRIYPALITPFLRNSSVISRKLDCFDLAIHNLKVVVRHVCGVLLAQFFPIHLQ